MCCVAALGPLRLHPASSPDEIDGHKPLTLRPVDNQVAIRVDRCPFCLNDRQKGGAGKTGRMTNESRQDGADRRHVGAGRAHAAGQGGRPRRHRGGQPAVSRGGALADPDGIAAARPSGALRQLEQRVQTPSAAGLFSGFFERVFNALSDEFDFECVCDDGTVVSAHQKAAGARGGPAARASVVPGEA